MFMILNSKSGQ